MALGALIVPLPPELAFPVPLPNANCNNDIN
jgi:hypothetical protein